MHRSRIVRLCLALTTLALTACGGDKNAPIARCSGTITGSLQRTFDVCNGFDQLYRQSLDTTILTAVYDELTRTAESRGAAYTMSAAIELDGEPRAGRTVEPTCTLRVKASAQGWKANQGAGIPLGTCRMTVNEVLAYPQSGNTITYCLLRGNISGRLEAEPNATVAELPGAINLSLDFNLAPPGETLEEQAAKCPQPPAAM
jgi:hypothetical protein